MKAVPRLLLAVAAATATSGCVVAAIPVAAGGVVVAKRADQFAREKPETRAERRARKRAEKAARRNGGAATIPALNGAPVAGQIYRGNLPPPSGVATVGETPATGGAVPAGMQFLYGSGEAAALSLQAYLALNDWMMAKATARQIGQPVASVVLAPGATLDAPRYLPCTAEQPLAVVLDIDETSLLNLGYEAEDARRGASAFDDARWDAWEKTGGGAVAAVPGALEAHAVAGAAGVTFVYNSNRSAPNADKTAATLDRAGLGPAVHGSTLWLKGDVGGGSGKDARRAEIARKYCVIALVGDQLGDFSDLFNPPGATPAARRALVSSKALKTIWGHGWFVLPNPVYGSGLKGGMDDVFPADKRWSPAPATNDNRKDAN